ncbi:hypothetical protein ACFLYD_05860 [Chloroflexota bacterium]
MGQLHPRWDRSIVTFSLNDLLLALTSGEPVVKPWRVAGGHLAAILEGCGGNVLRMVFNPNGTLLTSGAAD